MIKWLLIAVLAIAILFAAFMFLTRDREFRSVVLMLERPRALNVALVQAAAKAAWGVQLASERIEVRNLPNAQTFTLPTRHGDILVHAVAQRYGDSPVQARDLALRKRLDAHQAWLAVDEPSPSPDAFADVLKLASELMSDAVIAVYIPHAKRLHIANDDVRVALRTADAKTLAEELTSAPVVEANEEDPKLQQAIAQARAKYPEFVKAYKANAGDAFAVKGPFGHGDNIEHIWVEVDAIDGDQIRGTIANEPLNERLKLGDPAKVRVGEISDWMIRKGDDHIGGFTVDALSH